VSGDLENLKRFIAALKKHCKYRFDVDNLESKIKLQKYVYFAREFGLEFPYEFNLYIYGPYSPDLAKDYYSINRIDVEPMELPEEFINFLSGKDVNWLEIASTYLMIWKRYNRPKKFLSYKRIYELVRSAKPFARDEELEDITKTFKEYHII